MNTNPTSSNTTIIWDLPTRLFHWGLVAGITTCWISASWLDNAMTLHIWAGYFTLSLLLFRMMWGFVGSETARFSHFLRMPKHVISYASTLTLRQPSKHPGHNPLGGWSVIILLAASLFMAITGLFANDQVSTWGPLAHRVTDDLSDRITDWHRTGFDILTAVIGLHLTAIAFYRFYKQDNLILPMITGKSTAPSMRPMVRVGNLRALLMYVISTGIVAAVVLAG